MSPSRQLRSHMCTHTDTCGSLETYTHTHTHIGRVYPLLVSAGLKDWGVMKEGWRHRGRETQRKGGDLEKGKVEGGAAVCDERLWREGGGEERRKESLHPSLFLPQSELQCELHVRYKWELMKLFCHVSIWEDCRWCCTAKYGNESEQHTSRYNRGCLCIWTLSNTACLCTKRNR